MITVKYPWMRLPKKKHGKSITCIYSMWSSSGIQVICPSVFLGRSQQTYYHRNDQKANKVSSGKAGCQRRCFMQLKHGYNVSNNNNNKNNANNNNKIYRNQELVLDFLGEVMNHVDSLRGESQVRLAPALTL